MKRPIRDEGTEADRAQLVEYPNYRQKAGQTLADFPDALGPVRGGDRKTLEGAQPPRGRRVAKMPGIAVDMLAKPISPSQRHSVWWV